MIATIPINFDIFDHITRFKPQDYSISDFNIDHSLFIITQLYKIPSDNVLKKEQAELNEGYVEISSKYLQHYFKDYAKYFRYFISTGVMETDNYYIQPSATEGKTKCYGYRFTKKYIDSEPITFSYQGTFRKKIIKIHKKNINSLHGNYNHLTKMFYPDFKLKIDHNKAFQFIKIKKEAQLINSALRDKKKDYKNGVMVYRNPIDQYKYSYHMINSINHCNFDCKVDDNVHRIYNSLTNIYSPLRNFITHNSETLYSIDISNSQPYLSLILFNQNTYNKNNIIYNTTRETYNQLSPIFPKLSRLTELVNNEDFIKFQNLVGNTGLESHDLYSYMLEKSAENKVIYNSRAEAKEGMFEVLFSSNRYKTKTKKLFYDLFPTIDEMFRSIKSDHHPRLPILLQNIESHLVLNVITKRLANKHPNMPLYTIHDSIATTEPFVKEVQQCMIDVLTKKVGVPPKLKVEKWCASNLDEITLTYAAVTK